MPAVMLYQREVRRVSLDFDAPVGKTWAPLLEYPEEFKFPGCPVCGPPAKECGHNFGIGRDGSPHGDGLTREARAIYEMKYANPIGRPYHDHVAWMDKLGIKEVELLNEKETFTRGIDCPAGCTQEKSDPECEQCKGKGWTREVLHPTAEEVNAANRELSVFHPLSVFANDRIVDVRCELLGIQLYCGTCEGHGDIATAEERKKAEEWRAPEPPTGPGYQLWQTVSEGGPVSPVFETEDALAGWLADNYDMLGHRLTKSEWLEVIRDEVMGTNIQTGELVR